MIYFYACLQYVGLFQDLQIQILNIQLINKNVKTYHGIYIGIV